MSATAESPSGIMNCHLELCPALSELFIHDPEVWSYRGVGDENNVVVSAREVERTHAHLRLCCVVPLKTASAAPLVISISLCSETMDVLARGRDGRGGRRTDDLQTRHNTDRS